MFRVSSLPTAIGFLLSTGAYAATIHGPTEAPKPPSPAKDVDPPERTKNAPEPDFRKVRWGASIAEVKASEPGLPESETAGLLTYTKVKQWSVPGTALYEFHEGKLIRGTFTAESSKSFKTIWQRYSELERRLMSRYPKPVVNERQWKGNKETGGDSFPPGAIITPQNYQPRAPTPADDADLMKYCVEGEINAYIVWKNSRSLVSLEIGKNWRSQVPPEGTWIGKHDDSKVPLDIGKDGCTAKMVLSPRADKP